MLELYVGEQRLFDEATSKIKTIKGDKLQLEHSLVSISKWEAIWHIPFLSEEAKTEEQTLSYVKCMTLNEVDDKIYSKLTKKDVKTITEYIDNTMTATWFREDKKKKKAPSKEVVTSELIYYWMIALQIPSEYQYWHLKRLLTLIRICSIKNQPEKKMSKNELYERQAAINKARRAQYAKK